MARDCPKMDFAVRISKIQLQIWNQLFQGLMCAYFQAKLAQKQILVSNFKKLSPNLELALPRYHVCQFSNKMDTFDFLNQSLPKIGLGLEIQKTNVGIRINILEKPCVTIWRQNGRLWLFWSKFGQKWVLRSEFQKSKSGSRISTSEISCVPIFSQNEQIWIFRPEFGEIAQLRAIFWF